MSLDRLILSSVSSQGAGPLLFYESWSTRVPIEDRLVSDFWYRLYTILRGEQSIFEPKWTFERKKHRFWLLSKITFVWIWVVLVCFVFRVFDDAVSGYGNFEITTIYGHGNGTIGIHC